MTVKDRVAVSFRDRLAAGRVLALRLSEENLAATSIVLGIPRGGMVVAAEAARRLALPLDVMVAHKISPPWHRELAVGAVAADGTRVIDAGGPGWLGSADAMRDELAAELDRARERQRYLRAGRPPLALAGRDAVIVDDGMATGATMEAAVRAAARAGAGRVVVAVPVASPAAVERLEAVAAQVIVLAAPESFLAVGEFYESFEPVTDGEVRGLLLGAGAEA